MQPGEVAHVARDASEEALYRYLRMCGLDSPWEVPEAYLAGEAANALANKGLRVAVEFKLDRDGDHPKKPESDELPERLRRAYAHLDVAILTANHNDPWALKVDGVVEFKKHASVVNDADLIEFMIAKKPALYGVIVLLVVGHSEMRVEEERDRLIKPVLGSGRWKEFPDRLPPRECPPLGNTNVGDRWWTICCLISP